MRLRRIIFPGKTFHKLSNDQHYSAVSGMESLGPCATPAGEEGKGYLAVIIDIAQHQEVQGQIKPGTKSEQSDFSGHFRTEGGGIPGPALSHTISAEP